MDLGYKDHYPATIAEAPPKPKTCYPTTSIRNKDLGVSLAYDDYFTATVRFRVKDVQHGEGYSGEERNSLELELCSMDDITKSKKGLPQHK